MDQVCVPGGRHADHLWEVGGVASKGYAVQTLVPPIVFGNPEARDCRGMVPHLLDLFFEGHAADQVVHALVRRQSGIHKRKSIAAVLRL